MGREGKEAFDEFSVSGEYIEFISTFIEVYVHLK